MYSLRCESTYVCLCTPVRVCAGPARGTHARAPVAPGLKHHTTMVAAQVHAV